MSEPFIGEICCFGFNFAPRGWAQCNGQSMSIAQYSALYSILGTTYGGDGVTTFDLPNLQGRIPMHWGSSTTGLNTTIGAPKGTTPVPQSYLSQIKGDVLYQTNPAINTNFSPRAISPFGSSLPHEIMQPYLTLNFCISLEGTFPTPP